MEQYVVLGALLIPAVYLGWHLWRSGQKSHGCDSGCGGCPHAKDHRGADGCRH